MAERAGQAGARAGEDVAGGRSYAGLPDFLQSVKLKYVKLGYHYLITHGMYLLLLVPLLLAHLSAAPLTGADADHLRLLWDHLRYNLVATVAGSALVVFLGVKEI